MTEHQSSHLTAEIIDEAIRELHSIHDWLRWSVSQFNKAHIYFGHGTDNPWDEAALLLAHSLDMARITENLLPLRMTSTEAKAFCDLLLQRIEQRIPAAYLTQQAFFCGLSFYVDERVLVPRSPIGE